MARASRLPTAYKNSRDAVASNVTIGTPAVAAGATPTKAEYDALVNQFNTLTTALKSVGIVK